MLPARPVTENPGSTADVVLQSILQCCDSKYGLFKQRKLSG